MHAPESTVVPISNRGGDTVLIPDLTSKLEATVKDDIDDAQLRRDATDSLTDIQQKTSETISSSHSWVPRGQTERLKSSQTKENFRRLQSSLFFGRIFSNIECELPANKILPADSRKTFLEHKDSDQSLQKSVPIATRVEQNATRIQQWRKYIQKKSE